MKAYLFQKLHYLGRSGDACKNTADFKEFPESVIEHFNFLDFFGRMDPLLA